MKTYSPELKAQVIAGFALGLSKSALAKKYHVPRTTVIDWLTTTEPPVPTVTDMSQRERLGELVYEYLVTGFEALIAQNRVAQDPAFLRLEGTSFTEVYRALHAGVVSIAEAIERGQPVALPEPTGDLP